MFLAIEIGGTKIQLAVGRGDGSPLVSPERFKVQPGQGAEKILEGVERLGKKLVAAHQPGAVGIGFGGPVNAARGRVIRSHHVAGWEDYPLVDWCRRAFDLPAVVANDADTAGFAEARLGAGRGKSPVFYITIGTGIGGALVIDGEIYRGSGNAAAELGHLRPGLDADRPDMILESLAAGWGIAAEARRRVDAAGTQARVAWPGGQDKSGATGGRAPPAVAGGRAGARVPVENKNIAGQASSATQGDAKQASRATQRDAEDLLTRCDGRLEQLTTKHIGQAAIAGNRLAQEVLNRAWRALGWGIAQMITLVSPEVVVIGGGVSLLGEEWCFKPLRREVTRYVFPPLADSYEIVPAALGEEVVLHGALALAAEL